MVGGRKAHVNDSNHNWVFSAARPKYGYHAQVIAITAVQSVLPQLEMEKAFVR